MPGHPSKPSFQCLTFITSLDNLKHVIFQTVIFDCMLTKPFSHFDTTYEENKNIFESSYASNLLNYIQVNQQMIKKTNCQTTLLTIVIYEFGICLIRNTE